MTYNHNLRCLRALLLASAVLLFAFLLAGCHGHDQTTDRQTFESHKLRPPMPAAVPKGMNK